MKYLVPLICLTFMFSIGCSSVKTSSKNPSRAVAQVKPKSLLAMCYGSDDAETCLRSGVETIKNATSCVVDEAELKVENCQYSPPQSSSGFDGGSMEFKGVLYCQILTQNCMNSQNFGESEHKCPQGFIMKTRKKTDAEVKKFAWISSIHCEQ